MAKREEVNIEEGSTNVFADLGYADAEEHLAKARLVRVIANSIEVQGLTQTDAAERMGIDQPSVSRLLKGSFRGYSMDRLIVFLNRLGQDVTITIGPQSDQPGHTLVAVCQ